jgi:multiple antibiotic resistance protein
MIHELLKAVLLIVAALFPIINPPASGFIVLGMTSNAGRSERADLARRIAINSFVILLASLSIGAYVLSFFDISIPVLRVAGGIVIAMAGWRLLGAPNEECAVAAQPLCPTVSPPTSGECSSLREKSFYPLTLPITVGPGSIAVAIALGTGSPRSGLSPVHVAGVAIALALLSVSIYVCVRFAGHVAALIGESGMRIAMRLFAFVIFCIGVQILWLGFAELAGSLRVG